MVAKITCPRNINRALNYNEQKVGQGKAECLYAGNFLREAGELNFYEKLHRFEHQNALNDRAKTNTLHISLNFDAGDKLDRETLIQIASDYLEKIGFGKQPYLVYQHYDAGHTHLHLVTTSIGQDGKRINTYNIGKNQSERARKELELAYKLVPAESKKQQYKQVVSAEEKWKESLMHQAVGAQRVQYGKMETKRAIQNVLDAVINHYKYTSLSELNAVLKLYNVIADRGAETSRLYQMKGLYYRVLDERGNKIGAPIKASVFYMKPTLKYLERKFVQNETLKQPHKQKIKTRINWALFKGDKTIPEFRKALEKEGIQVVVRQNDKGMIYGITYIDFNSKCVFNGSDLGKEYSAKGIIERCKQQQELRQESGQAQGIGRPTVMVKAFNMNKEEELNEADEKKKEVGKGLEELLKPERTYNYVPFQLLQRKRKKKPNNRLHL